MSTWQRPPASRSAPLLGAAESLYERAGIALPPHDRLHYERALTATQTQLGDERFAALRAEGRTLTVEQAIEEAQALAAQLVRLGTDR